MRATSDIVLLATGSARFCGSGTNKARVLHELGQLGYDANLVCLGKPHLLRSLAEPAFKVHVVKSPRSDFLGNSGILSSFTLAERLTELAIDALGRGHKQVVFWGTYLFPFAHAALCAKRNVLIHCGRSLPLVISPAGSDVWQIGPAQYYNARTLLCDPSITSRLTYSEQFADEIRERFHLGCGIDIIPPILTSNQFLPLCNEERIVRRSRMGITDEEVVIVSHSNMRPVKRPDAVFDVASLAASMQPNQKITLLLVGPRPSFEIKDHFFARLTRNKSVTAPSGLRVLWTGLSARVARFLQIADIALNCSVHDSFNISLLEAMACGVPCVTTAAAGIAPYIGADGAGVAVPTISQTTPKKLVLDPLKDVDVDRLGMASALAMLIMDKNLRMSMGCNASRCARNRFSTAATVRKYDKIMRRPAL